jgi:hypothetical protein
MKTDRAVRTFRFVDHFVDVNKMIKRANFAENERETGFFLWLEIRHWGTCLARAALKGPQFKNKSTGKQ